jgi:hypothetical protein
LEAKQAQLGDLLAPMEDRAPTLQQQLDELKTSDHQLRQLLHEKVICASILASFFLSGLTFTLLDNVLSIYPSSILFSFFFFFLLFLFSLFLSFSLTQQVDELATMKIKLARLRRRPSMSRSFSELGLGFEHTIDEGDDDVFGRSGSVSPPPMRRVQSDMPKASRPSRSSLPNVLEENGEAASEAHDGEAASEAHGEAAAAEVHDGDVALEAPPTSKSIKTRSLPSASDIGVPEQADDLLALRQELRESQERVADLERQLARSETERQRASTLDLKLKDMDVQFAEQARMLHYHQTKSRSECRGDGIGVERNKVMGRMVHHPLLNATPSPIVFFLFSSFSFFFLCGCVDLYSVSIWSTCRRCSSSCSCAGPSVTSSCPLSLPFARSWPKPDSSCSSDHAILR